MKAKLPEKDELAKLLDTLCANDTATAKLQAARKIIAMFIKLENENAMLRDEKKTINNLNVIVYASIFATAFILGALLELI